MKTLTLITSFLLGLNALAATDKAIITCEFPGKDKLKTVLSVDLKTKTAKQLNNQDLNEFPMYGDIAVTAHTTIYGDPVRHFNQISKTGSGQDVVWPAQLTLMGSNHDDSQFTLVIAYQIAECEEVKIRGKVSQACSQTVVRATLISYWDAIEGGSEAEHTNKCDIELK